VTGRPGALAMGRVRLGVSDAVSGSTSDCYRFPPGPSAEAQFKFSRSPKSESSPSRARRRAAWAAGPASLQYPSVCLSSMPQRDTPPGPGQGLARPKHLERTRPGPGPGGGSRCDGHGENMIRAFASDKQSFKSPTAAASPSRYSKQ
jgi:hypothetical protein